MNRITTDELRKLNDCEGIIFQGCGGDLKEWEDGVNGLLTEAEILRNGTKFTDVSVFENGALTCLLFKFTPDVDIDLGKLATWRIMTHEYYGGTWLSDYVDNRLGGFVKKNEVMLC